MSDDALQRRWLAPAVLAVALPPLLAWNQTPSSTFYNQALALFGWALLLLAAALALPAARVRAGLGLGLLLGAFGLVAALVLGSMQAHRLPGSLAWSALALLGAAAFAAWTGAALHGAGLQRPAFAVLAAALAAAAFASALVGLVQVFWPALADGRWIASPATPGRAVGNLRQPNHLASLLMWGLVAVVWLAESGRLRRRVALALGATMLFAVVLSASRTGLAGTLLLAAWALADRRLSRPARNALLAAPLAYALAWGAMTVWAQVQGQTFVGAARLLGGGDVSSSRFAIWRDTLALVATVPWTGVGFGMFNFAWTLTPFPQRPTAFFDHTHNLPLQFVVEFGLPLGLVATGLLLGALGLALRRAAAAPGDAPPSRAGPCDAPPSRAALAIVVMIGVHSLFEYPLWYAYFLLPAAFAFGLVLGGADAPEGAMPAAPAAARPPRAPALAALLLAAGTLFAVADYQRVVAIFVPAPGAPPLAQRIAAGERSVFFAHHAHYAAATVAPRPSQVPQSFASAGRFLLDTRLVIAWARAFDEAGDTERALHLADRLREFDNPDAEAFFAPCRGADPPRFPCAGAPRALDWRDFE